MKVEIFDPPMCCSSGICGPSVDPALLDINNAILTLKKQGVNVVRYDLRGDYLKIKDNETVMSLIHKNGSSVLPVTIVEDTVLKTGVYPSYEEICGALKIEPLKKGKPMTISVE